MNELIVSGVDKVSILPSKEAEKLKAELCKAAAKITKAPSTPQEDAMVAENIRELRQFGIGLEKTEAMVAGPLIAMRKKLKELAVSFGADVANHIERLKRLRGVYAEKVAEQQRRAAEEARKLEQERIRLEEEALRKRDEAEEKEDDSPLAAARAEKQAEKLQEKAQQIAEQESSVLTIAESDAPRGVKKVWDYEVVNLHELYASNPRLVQLTERRREILEHLQLLSEKGLPVQLPGLKTNLVTKVSSR